MYFNAALNYLVEHVSPHAPRQPGYPVEPLDSAMTVSPGLIKQLIKGIFDHAEPAVLKERADLEYRRDWN